MLPLIAGGVIAINEPIAPNSVKYINTTAATKAIIITEAQPIPCTDSQTIITPIVEAMPFPPLNL